MKQTVDESMFISRFEDYKRVESFGYDGLRTLFEYLEQLEDDLGEQIELDVVGICCDYSKYSISELWSEYSYLFQDLSRDDYESDDDLNEAMLDELRNYTTVIEVDEDNYIIQSF